MPPRPPATQDRSRRTEAALLDAAVALFRKHGIDSVTTTDIAAAANVSPATINRRFGDKDALVREAFRQFIDTSLAMLSSITPLPKPKSGLIPTIADVIAAVLHFSRANQGILQSAYARALVDHDFAAGIRELRGRTHTLLRGHFLAHAAEIQHPEPELAIEFALNQAVAMLSARLEASRLDVSTIDDEAFHRELMRSLLAYMQVPFTRREIDEALAVRGL